METINIVFSSDNNYAPYMGVAICSIFENKKEGYLIDIYVLDGGISEDNKSKLKFLENKYNFTISYIKIDREFFKDFRTNGYMTQASYYRIIIPELFPKINKILYLDCDIVVINDILELYNINIKNYYFAAVDDELYRIETIDKIGIPRGEKYCNSGVMLINVKKWRENQISKKIIEFTMTNQHNFFYHDQDAINGYLWGKWLNINFKYNYTNILINKYPLKLKDVNNKIIIIHYTFMKPWNYLYINPLKDKYFYYLKKTEWKNNRYINKNFKNIIIRFAENISMLTFPNSIIKILKKIKNFLKIKFY